MKAPRSLKPSAAIATLPAAKPRSRSFPPGFAIFAIGGEVVLVDMRQHRPKRGEQCVVANPWTGDLFLGCPRHFQTAFNPMKGNPRLGFIDDIEGALLIIGTVVERAENGWPSC